MKEEIIISLKFIPKKYRSIYLFMGISNIFNGFLEMFSLVLFYLFLKISLDPSAISNEIKINYSHLFEGLSNQEILIYLTIFILIILLLKSFVTFFLNFLNFYLIRKLCVHLSSKILSKYLNCSYSYFLEKNTSTLTLNVWQHTGQVVGKCIMGFQDIVGNIILLIFVCAPLLIYETKISVLSLLITFIGALINFTFFSKIIIKSNRKLIKSNKRLMRVVGEIVNGIKTIKVFNKAFFFEKIFNENINLNHKIQQNVNVINFFPRLFLEVIMYSTVFLYLTVNLIKGNSFIDILPTIGLFCAAAIRIIPTVNKLIVSAQLFQNARPSLEEIKDDYFLITENQSESSKKNFEFNHCIELKNVNFSYADNNILKNISLRINKGKIIGIAGRSGSGKSTLLSVLLGLLKIKDGKFLIDGKEKNNLNILSGNLFSYVPQNAFILDSSIKENILLSNDIGDENLITDVLKETNLLEKISKLPDGLNTILGESGKYFSGGEIQRLTISRCLYHKKKIIILDEPTSSIDKINERKIKELFLKLKKKGITIIIVAHNLDLMKNCDEIYLLDNGEIVNSGKYSMLIKNENLFNKLI